MKKLFFTLLILTLAFPCVYAQNILRGKITDEDGTPIAGVSVLEKGSISGTSSNAEGRYQLKYSGPNSIAVFRYIGFATQEIVRPDRFNR